ncbi:MAG: hypothetical protein KJP00_10335, partial [Bacteroidia bacterium]|nr:hypothetical protein [Bacteroidia bacterium]
SGVESDSDSEHLKNEVTQITKTPQSSSDSELQDFTTTSPINFAESTSATTSEELTPTTRLAQLSTLSSINDQVFSRDLPFLDFRDKDSWSKCEVKIPGHFFVDLYGMGALPMDKIELQPGSDQFVYRDLWDDRFDPVSSWHGGIQAGYQFPWGLSISAGLEYQHLITKYEDDQSITEMITIWDPMAYFYRDSNNDIVWVGDSVTAINIYERKVVSENKTTLYHLPVQVSIELYKKPNFHIAADVAAILNFSKSYTGQFIRSDQTLIAIDSGNHDNYLKTDIGISYEAGIRMGYFFNDNWEAYLSPRFRYNPNSYLLDSEVLKVTRNFVGLRTGVRYHF